MTGYRVSATRGSAVRECISRPALRVVSALHEEPAVTKSRVFNTLLNKFIKSTYQVLAYRAPPSLPRWLMKALVKFMDKILGLTGRLGVQEANESDS